MSAEGTEDEGDDRAGELARAALISGGLAAVGLIATGPAGVGLAAAGPYVEHGIEAMWHRMTGRRRERVVTVLTEAASHLECDVDDLERRARDTSGGTALLDDTIAAAASTTYDLKVYALARALATGCQTAAASTSHT